jgi:hypothetical protein
VENGVGHLSWILLGLEMKKGVSDNNVASYCIWWTVKHMKIGKEKLEGKVFSLHFKLI